MTTHPPRWPRQRKNEGRSSEEEEGEEEGDGEYDLRYEQLNPPAVIRKDYDDDGGGRKESNGNKRSTGSYGFDSQNPSCPFCQEIFKGGVGKSIVHAPTCGHTYHLQCNITAIWNSGKDEECPICTNVTSINDGRIILQNGNYPSSNGGGGGGGTYKTKSSIRREKQEERDCQFDERYYQGVYGDRQLTITQKGAFLKVSKPFIHPKKVSAPINFDVLMANNLGMKKIHEAGVDLLDMWFSMKIITWKQLKDLGMKSKYLYKSVAGSDSKKKGDPSDSSSSNESDSGDEPPTIMSAGGGGAQKFMPLDTLIDLYHVDYGDLETIGFDLNNIVQLQLSCTELWRLQLTIDELIAMGLNTRQFVDNMQFNAQDCVDFLDMRTKHLFQLNIKAAEFRLLDWDAKNTIRNFGISELEIKGLELGVQSNNRNEAERQQRRRRQQQQRDPPKGSTSIQNNTRRAREYTRREQQQQSSSSPPPPRLLPEGQGPLPMPTAPQWKEPKRRREKKNKPPHDREDEGGGGPTILYL